MEKQTSPANLNGSHKSASELYKERNYEEAARLLKERGVVHRSDDDKSLLASCLYHLQQYSEVIEFIKTMESPGDTDLEMAGVAALRLDQYEPAKEFLIRATAQSPHPNIKYLLAIALRGDRWDYSLDSETRENIIGLLESASDLPECPLEALLWLESLQKYNVADIRKRASFLQKAIESYPDAGRECIARCQHSGVAENGA